MPWRRCWPAREHADRGEHRIHLDGVLGSNAPALGAIAVELLDATLRGAAVAAHVPFASRAARARRRVGATDDPGDQIAGREVRAGGRLEHPLERLVPENEPVADGHRPAIMAGHGLDAGAAHAEGERFRQQRPIASGQLRDLRERRGGLPFRARRSTLAFRSSFPAAGPVQASCCGPSHEAPQPLRQANRPGLDRLAQRLMCRWPPVLHSAAFETLSNRVVTGRDVRAKASGLPSSSIR
jgi:hypothetical protein